MKIQRLTLAIFALLSLTTPLMGQIKAGQAIQITISGVPAEEKQRFDQMYPVSDTGTINMPLIGKVRAAGLKPDTLSTILQKKYKEAQIYTQPTFQVFADDQAKIEQQVVVVGGYVRRPGPVPYTRQLTLWQAIQTAGGPTEFGSMKRVALTRGGTLREYDAEEPKNQQIRLQPGDTIDVPQTGIFEGIR